MCETGGELGALTEHKVRVRVQRIVDGTEPPPNPVRTDPFLDCRRARQGAEFAQNDKLSANITPDGPKIVSPLYYIQVSMGSQ